jgi:hypothetical protein
MNKRLWFGLPQLLLMATPALAQSAFDGSWKYDLKSGQMSEKPSVMLLQGGMYQCKTCIPPININADGRDQKVSGDPYRDTISIKVVDDRTVDEIGKKNGKVVNTARRTASVDGNTLIIEFTDSNANPVAGKAEATRVEKGPAGSHAISGSWKTTKSPTCCPNGLWVTFRVEGYSLTMTTPTGQSYTAKLDGTEAPFKGDTRATSVLVKGLGNNRLEEIDKRDGDVITVTLMTVSADGKSMIVSTEDKRQGTWSKWIATKQ